MMHFLFHKLLSDHKRLGKYLKPVVWGKNSGMSKLGRSLGVLKWFRRDLDKAEDIVEKLPKQSFRDKLPNITLSPPNPTKKIGYFLGCGFNFVLPHCSEATIDVLVRQGLQVVVPDTGCCGLPAYVYGDLEAAKKMARKNIEYLDSLGVDTILTECASCSSFLKDYAELLADDPDWSERASQISKKIVGFSEYMVDKLPEVENSTSTPLKVTYHDPCHLCRYQNITQEPRQLLKQTPGVEFVELPEADLCCGAAGSYNIMHYDQSMVVLDRKMKNLQNIEADVLTTECPACCIQLSYGVRKYHLPTKVLHISELIRDRYWSNHK
jgi:glycolate oxidase iron-sulfur subunit